MNSLITSSTSLSIKSARVMSMRTKESLGRPFEIRFYDRFIQETHILPETEQVPVAVMYDHHGRMKIASDRR